MGFIEIIEDEETFVLKVEDSEFDLRRFDSEVYNEIEKRHTKTTKNRRTGIPFGDPNPHEINKDLLDYMIRGWRNIKSPVTGEDVPCTREMKLKLPGSIKLQITEACDSGSITEKKKNLSSSGDM